jgi:TolB-like protein/Flp pilus assembly protein TadD
VIGRRIAHYEILALLGKGGMGEVYRARDTRLAREVALKILPAAPAADPHRRARFQTEARALASLNHPHVVHIYSVEEAEGVDFLTMELVEGQGLDRLLAAGPLPPARVLAIGAAVAEALDAAHRRGVIHRDLKPANVVVDGEDRVKVLDFGLAKLLAPPVDDADETRMLLTREGTIQGTLPYMAPEQIRGGSVDARSDLFSLGVLLHEMATGSRPFTGATPPELISAILRDAPAPLAPTPADLPEAFATVVRRCLEKEPAQRPRSAREVADALAALRHGSAAVPPGATSVARGSRGQRSARWSRPAAFLLIALIALLGSWQIRSGCAPRSAQGAMAVLPFLDRNEDPDTAYLSEGITESLILRLSEIDALPVMSRHSVARFKDADRDVQAIGRLLGVDLVLAGHLELREDRLVVGVELVDVDDGRQIWGDRFDRPMTDLLTIEREIVDRLSEELRLQLSPRVVRRLEAMDVVDPQAYNLYLKGRYFLWGTSDDGAYRAQEYFQKALEISPLLAPAWAGLGDAYVTQAWLNSAERDVIVPRAKAALERAMEIDPDLGEAHVLDGAIKLWFDWDWSGAETAFRRALELQPGSDLAHREYGSFLCIMGRMEEALRETRTAQTLDPLSVIATHEVAFTLMMMGRYREAAAEFQKALELNPTWLWGNIKLGRTYTLLGEIDRALACADRADALLDGEPASPLAENWLSVIHLAAGDSTRARESLRRLEEKAKTGYVDPVVLAIFHYDLGEHEAAILLLEQGYASRSPLMVFLDLDRIRFLPAIASDPRFEDLHRRMAFPVPDPSPGA